MPYCLTNHLSVILHKLKLNLMKKLFTYLFLTVATTSFGQNWSATGAAATAGGGYLVAATSIGDNVYAVGSTMTFVRSPNRGVTWTAPAISQPAGAFYELLGCNNYLYASLKINNYDNEIRYSLNHGMTWIIDTVGLPKNLPNTGKEAMKLRYMGNNYVVAFNDTKSYYKKLGTTNWIATTIDYVVVDVIGMNDKWYAIGATRLYKSENHGVSWTQITPTGLTSGFQGHKWASNGLDRLFISNAPADGGVDIYISTDAGASFSSTNAAGQYTYTNPILGAMFAVDNHIFAAVTPETGNSTDAPPFITSSAVIPNFSVGNRTGLITGSTIAPLPFFFNCGNKLFTMYGDLYTSSPGFVGAPVSVGVNTVEQLNLEVSPNPAQDVITISNKDNVNFESIKLYSTQGQLVKEFKSDNSTFDVSTLPRGYYILKLQSSDNVTTKKIILE